ncbi:MAG: hypothetical protein SFY69_12795 [Planctomycetota bacterium]|nr:hypothetical protein [Planctomycetota bacterium]
MKFARRRQTILLSVMLMGGFALLIWLKLRVVTGVPRTAYADPTEKRAHPEPTPAPNASGPERATAPRAPRD